MDQKPMNAYQRFVAEREAERENRLRGIDATGRDDVDRCDGVYRPHGRGDDDEPEYY